MLIKFPDDTIFVGAYCGTTDILFPYIIKYEDFEKVLDDNTNNIEDIFDYCEKMDHDHYDDYLKNRDKATDIEDVEIYIRYCEEVILSQASKSKGMITGELEYCKYPISKYLDDIPQWVHNWLSTPRRI